MPVVSLRWPDFQSLIASKGLSMQYVNIVDGYSIFATENGIAYNTIIINPINDYKYPWADPSYSDYGQSQNDADYATFTSAHLANCNQPNAGAVALAQVPLTSDGRLVILPNFFPETMQVCFPGAGDDPVLGIGQGTMFQHQSNDDGYGPTTHTITWNFNDWLYLSGGHIVYQGAVFGDTISYNVRAPATSVSTVSGTGNASVVGGVMITPGVNTNTEVNLSTAVPVPSLTNTGYWNWTPASNALGAGAITPNLTGTGAYNLYTIPLTLGNFVINYSLMGSNYIDLTVPALLPKKVLPQWVHEVQVNNSGHDGLQVIWALTVSRTTTVGM